MILAQLESIPSLAEGGPLWSLVGILIVLVWLLIKMLLAEKDKRIQDAINYRNDLVKPLADIGKTLERIEDKTIIAKGRR